MRRVVETVPLAEARRRALAYLVKQGGYLYVKANCIGYAIWPGVDMTSQGAGAAASRILKGMEKDGLVKYSSSHLKWGYGLTARGRTEAAKEEANERADDAGSGAEATG